MLQQYCLYLFKLVFSYSSAKYGEVELLDHMVVLFLCLWGNSILFSIVTAPIYIPTNSAKVFPFPTYLPKLVICLLIIVILAGMRQYFIWVLIWIFLMISDLKIFSCVCCPSICLLQKNFCSGPSHFLIALFGFFIWYWHVWVLYKFWILIPYQIHHLQISFLIQEVAFSFCWQFSSLCRSCLV